VTKWWVLVFFSLLVVAPIHFTDTQLSSAKTVTEPDYWPTDGWRVSTPEEHGMRSEVLAQIMPTYDELDLNVQSFLLVRHGYIVFEEYPDPWYQEDRPHFLASVTKSFTAGLIGIALDHGYISSLSDRVIDCFSDRTIANLSALKEMMTVRDLLTMKTGMQWDEGSYSYWDTRNSFVQMENSDDWVQFILDRPMETFPDRKWYYNTGASHLLSALINQTAGNSTLAFAREHLFEPLGMGRSYWATDPQGINPGGYGLSLTPRDMAKYAFLYLHQGEWEGDQIISADWVVESTLTHTMLVPGNGYGYHWITFPQFNAYAAFGAGGQGICVFPDYDLIAIITAEEALGLPFMEILLNYVLPSLTDVPSAPCPWKAGFVLMIALGLSIPIVYVYGFKRRQHNQEA
jgi:CubicO group peptidase (beta-lactamase class C family)